MKRFDGLSVLITGATGGFGRRAAERFAGEGAKLILSDVNPEALQAFAATLDCETALLSGDISQESLSKDLVKLAVEKFGRLDVALNNAGIAQSYVKLPNVPSDEARRILEIDLLGVFFAMSYQIPQMERQFRRTGKGGAIVNVASVAGVAGAPRLSVYSAAKHGVVGLTRSAAAEYASKGVRVNAVCPAFARTKMAMDMLGMSTAGTDAAIADLTRGVPMKRLAEVDEIVEVFLFAADPKNSFMTGQAIAADGGITAI
ncbi:SDR family NAD(P)-dependent oxidoreductase [Tianweitania populi]|uniref:SDR family NAD(P)-dependent oxidoreductase n=1 Tax=Tianweitania populi TaxID=1607949 RepID=UPI001677B8A0|nr:SDR family oxidoreductase [Tianweitania populi]